MITLRQAGVGAIAVGATLLAYYIARDPIVEFLACVGAAAIAHYAMLWFGGEQA